MSSLSWLAYDEREADSLRTLVAALRETEARDPLGVGVVRDAVAEVLFPGVSTVMTRARYFLFVPRLLLRLEELGLHGRGFADERRTGEVAIIRNLIAGGHGRGEGVIGRTSLEGTKQLPSTVYWGGLGTLGIRRVDLSLPRYENALATIYARRAARAQTGASHATFDVAVPEGPDGTEGAARFELTREEAVYLTERALQRVPGSLLAAALVDDVDMATWSDGAGPWVQPWATLHDRARRVLAQAEVLSLVLHGAQLAYNHELALRTIEALHLPADSAVAGVRDQMDVELDHWCDEMGGRRADVRGWRDGLPTLWDDLGVIARARRAVAFITWWVDTVVGAGVDAVRDKDVRERLTQREADVKGRNARATNAAAMTAWAREPTPQAAARLTFRWPTARVLIADIRGGRGAAAL